MSFARAIHFVGVSETIKDERAKQILSAWELYKLMEVL